MQNKRHNVILLSPKDPVAKLIDKIEENDTAKKLDSVLKNLHSLKINSKFMYKKTGKIPY